MRDKIVAGNWKMNLTFEQALQLANDINTWASENKPNAKVIIAPTSIYLQAIQETVDEEFVQVASQDVSNTEKGAFTGDISAEQLDSIGINCAIVGHSERREYQQETDAVIAQKLEQLFNKDITPILCVGEKLEEREADKHFEVVKSQILNALNPQKTENLSKLVIAYEPVWAIGTGVTASPEQAQEIHAFIRSVLNDAYGADVAEGTSILYGGSVNAANAEELFAQADIDGGLVGGASLKVEDFSKIISAF
ncbi:triose-phosphate isomerase [Faecalibacter macacae]|uniref:Triosephosphate isomerase n=1 Tax=Faecalibacter macacae TaxID=1859289 RepID=A0A3L9M475_9FLAO|nr:triose-phosphate isomerase [Faecalibacter macacae]RLZ07571.1 triose-phosphate isomerase [Faecalibacter macacae]